jgi:hypothetical protein
LPLPPNHHDGSHWYAAPTSLGTTQRTTEGHPARSPRSGDSLENIRKKKWLAIAERYPAMKQDDQQRMQDRMREWAGLSPLERSKVRDTYKDFKQLPAEQKQVVKQKWQAYSNLPPEERQRLRESGKSSKLLSSPGTPPDAPSAEATAGITPTPAPLNTSEQR